jgi:hypothetical protein
MDKYIVINGKKQCKVEYEYNIGEIITMNSTQDIKCIRKEEVDGELLQHFIKPRIIWDE